MSVSNIYKHKNVFIKNFTSHYKNTGNPCVTLSSITHGNITCTGYTTSHICYFRCNEGFNLIGPNERQCLPSSQWSGVDPMCDSKSLKC